MKSLRLVPATETAAILILRGFSLRGVRPNGRGVGFLFDDSPDLQEALLRFTNGEIQVEPRGFLRTLNDLRDLARSELSPT